MDPLLLVFFYRVFTTAGLVMKYSSTKSGFSLIELMVAIVIMGALSAIAVPKLFGQMAKAKASELYSSAGSYIHLQDTYNAEYNERIGSWKVIGYIMPSNKDFKYYEGSNEGGNPTASTVSVDEGEQAAWKAVNNVPLNDCDAGSIWQMDVKASNTKAYNLEYNVSITDGDNGACHVITRHFSGLDSHNKIVDAP